MILTKKSLQKSLTTDHSSLFILAVVRRGGPHEHGPGHLCGHDGLRLHHAALQVCVRQQGR
jgi:hypothetical protein